MNLHVTPETLTEATETTTPKSPLHETIAEFFSTTDANEISQTLARMVSSYLEHSDGDKIKIANNCHLVMQLQALLFTIEKQVS